MIEKNIQPFKPAALKRISEIIGNAFKGYEITDLFKTSGHPEICHDGRTKWIFLYDVLQKFQIKESGTHDILKFIEIACDPQEYFGNQPLYKSIIKSINEALAFYALKISDKGIINSIDEPTETLNVPETEDSKLFSHRNFHSEIIKHARDQFIQAHYFDAVDECCKAFDKYVSQKSNNSGSGSKLMGSVLSSNGVLKLNPCSTESEKNQQDGLMHLCMGLMKGTRNLLEHEPQIDFKIDRQDALDMLSLISYLYKQIDKCTLA